MECVLLWCLDRTPITKEVIMAQYDITVEVTFTGEAESHEDAIKQTREFLDNAEFVSDWKLLEGSNK